MHLTRRHPARPWLVVIIAALVALLCAAGLTPGSSAATLSAAGGQRSPYPAASARASGCDDPYSGTRDRANPLMLSPAPSHGNVLSGAHFFVPGPARGTAAGAIAQLLGIGVGQPLASGQPLAGLPDTLSWASFRDHTVANELPRQTPTVQRNITLLEKIANEPSPLRISAYSGGGTPAAIAAQTTKLFCTVLQADPGTIPIITTYFLHAELGGCSSASQINAKAPYIRSQIDAMAQAIERRPAALFLELDAVGSSSCMAHHGSLGAWEKLMKYEALTFEALPHTAVYIEGGYSDSGTAAYAARVLNAMGVRQVQGFFTNDTHLQWTSHELSYAKAISARTGGAHFVINTANNGRGPKLNPHPSTQGIEALCNPPGRGLGIPDTTSPGLDRHLDGLLWIVPPGNSSGTCNGSTTPAGAFSPTRAEGLAARANAQLGPGYPSRPY